jgi:hypothetical protein
MNDPKLYRFVVGVLQYATINKQGQSVMAETSDEQ